MLSEAVILAVCGTIQAIATLVAKAMDGQTPEQRRQMWDWYIQDIEHLRKALHLSE